MSDPNVVNDPYAWPGGEPAGAPQGPPGQPGPGQPHGYVPQEGFGPVPQQAPQQPVQPPKKRGAGRLLIVGALVMGLVALGLGAWFVLGRGGGGGGGSDATALADLGKAPEDAWTASLVDRGNADWVEVGGVIPMDGSRLLSWTTPDIDFVNAEVGDDVYWYEGYDEHYDAGSKSGQQYQADIRAYYASSSYSATYPKREDYWPKTYGVDFSMRDARFLGWYDGFADATNGTTTKKSKPQLPTIGAVSMLNADNGEVIWSVELAALGVSPQSSSTSITYADTGDIVVASARADGTKAPDLTVHVLSAKTGEELTNATMPGSGIVDFHQYDPSRESAADTPLVVTGTDPGSKTDSSFVAAYSLQDLTKPLWEWSGPGYVSSLPTGGRYVSVRDSKGAIELLDAKTGEMPTWLASPVPGESYQPTAQGAVRIERIDSGNYMVVSMLDKDAKQVWEQEFDAFFPTVNGKDMTLFSAEKSSSSGFRGLNKVNQADGKPAWKKPYDGSFTTVTEGAGLVVVSDDSRATGLDPKTGEKVASFRGDSFMFGKKTVYTREPERLTAWTTKGEKLWDARLREGQYVLQVPGRMLVLDNARKQITAWR